MNGDANTPTAALKAHLVGERLDEVEPTPVIPAQVFLDPRIGHSLWIEAFTLIFNANVYALIAHGNIELYFLARIESIAVLRRIHDDLVDEQLRPVGFIIPSIKVFGRERMGLTNQFIKARTGAPRRKL